MKRTLMRMGLSVQTCHSDSTTMASFARGAPYKNSGNIIKLRVNYAYNTIYIPALSLFASNRIEMYEYKTHTLWLC